MDILVKFKFDTYVYNKCSQGYTIICKLQRVGLIITVNVQWFEPFVPLFKSMFISWRTTLIRISFCATFASWPIRFTRFLMNSLSGMTVFPPQVYSCISWERWQRRTFGNNFKQVMKCGNWQICSALCFNDENICSTWLLLKGRLNTSSQHRSKFGHLLQSWHV